MQDRSRTKLIAAVAACGFLAAAGAHAEPVDDTLTVETDDGPVEFVTKTAAPEFLKGTLDTI